MREFKDSISGKSSDDDDDDDDRGRGRDAFGNPQLDPAEAGARSATTEPEVVTGEPEPPERPAARRDA
jgi:hypothetical protein